MVGPEAPPRQSSAVFAPPSDMSTGVTSPSTWSPVKVETYTSRRVSCGDLRPSQTWGTISRKRAIGKRGNHSASEQHAGVAGRSTEEKVVVSVPSTGTPERDSKQPPTGQVVILESNEWSCVLATTDPLNSSSNMSTNLISLVVLMMPCELNQVSRMAQGAERWLALEVSRPWPLLTGGLIAMSTFHDPRPERTIRSGSKPARNQ